MSAVGKLFKFISKTIIFLFALLGILTAAVIACLIVLASAIEPSVPSLPEKFALVLNLDEDIQENAQEDFMAFLADTSLFSLKDANEAIKYAASDPKVDVLVGRLNSSWLGAAQVQEMHEALSAFKKAGKDSFLYSETIGMDGYGTSDYYLASGFKEIWLQPTGSVNITGLFMEAPFFNSLLQKIGVTTDFYARHEYKGGAENMTADTMSPYVRQNMESIADNLYKQIITKTAEARNIEANALEKLVNEAPLSATKALQNGLVDKLAYRDELEERIKDLPQISLDEYILYQKNYVEKKNKIALIYVNGMIISGQSNYPSFGDDNAFAGADDITEAIYEAAEDKDVKAIVIRINSPGGSYTASDAIWHALETVKAKHKIPVVASLGDTAASGGYFAAIGADKIVAMPASITGSIGVFGGKVSLDGLWQKIGVSWDMVQKGQNADMMSLNKSFSPAQRKAFEESLDEVYLDFTQKVAKARKLSPEALDKAARGRVFTGEQALTVGLVDELGSLDTAIEKAKELADINNYSVVIYPKPKSKIELLNEFIQSKNIISTIGYRLNTILYDTVLFSPAPKIK